MLDSAFGWLSDLISWFGQFFPRWVIVPTTHGAVKFVRGHKVVTLGPGWHIYWPLLTTFMEYPTARQATDLRTQTLTTRDEKTIVVGGIIVYEIRDLEKILAHTFDAEQTIKDISMGAIHDVCARRSWAELKAPGLDVALRKEVRKRLHDYGIRVLRVTLTDLAPTRVIKLMMAQSTEGL